MRKTKINTLLDMPNIDTLVGKYDYYIEGRLEKVYDDLIYINDVIEPSDGNILMYSNVETINYNIKGKTSISNIISGSIINIFNVNDDLYIICKYGIVYKNNRIIHYIDNTINCVALVGNDIILGTLNGIAVFNIADIEIKYIKTPGTPKHIITNRDNTLMAIAFDTYIIQIYKDLKLIHSFEYNETITCFLFDRKNNLITGSKSGEIIVWSPEGDVLNQLSHKCSITCIIVKFDNTIVSGDDKGFLNFWVEGQNTYIYRCYSRITNIIELPNRDIMVSDDGLITIMSNDVKINIGDKITKLKVLNNGKIVVITQKNKGGVYLMS